MSSHLVELSEHFTLYEFERSHKASKRGLDNAAPRPVRGNLRRVAQCLEGVRKHAAGGKPLHISSGYRCPELNAAVGGARTSYHVYGLAADIYSNRLSTDDLFHRIREAHAGGLLPGWDELILEFDRWVHLAIPPPDCDPLMKTLTARGEKGRTVYSPAGPFRP